MTKKILSVILSAVLLLPLGGCSATTTAQKTEAAIGAVLAVAQVEEANIPAADRVVYTAFVNLAVGLNSQLETCISDVSSMSLSKNQKFLACFNTFAAGLASPSELAELRILSPASQSTVETYLLAIVAGINALEAALGGQPLPNPSVSAAVIPNPVLYARLQTAMLNAAGM